MPYTKLRCYLVPSCGMLLGLCTETICLHCNTLGTILPLMQLDLWGCVLVLFGKKNSNKCLGLFLMYLLLVCSAQNFRGREFGLLRFGHHTLPGLRPGDPYHYTAVVTIPTPGASMGRSSGRTVVRPVEIQERSKNVTRPYNHAHDSASSMYRPIDQMADLF